MNKVVLLPSVVDKMMKIIDENNIVTQITLIQSGNSGIGTILEMEFEIDLNGRIATARIELDGVENW